MSPQIIALYLPQFHPIKENDDWYGAGFTEWTNVAKAKPLFKGHVQPRVPADLGFYDLRMPEIREKQAQMAKNAGIAAFCYYHYWFGNGKVLLEKPLQEVVRLGEPDFPFCVCWANHSWYKKAWNPDTLKMDNNLLAEQQYFGDEDIIAHFNFLLPAFQDKRYYKVDGRLLFVIYQIWDLPDFERFKEIWNRLAHEHGLPSFYFLSFANTKKELEKTKLFVTDGTILSLLHNMEPEPPKCKLQTLVKVMKEQWYALIKKPQFRYRYKDAMKGFLSPICKEENIIPVVIPNWDTTPRRGRGAMILTDAKPAYFKEHVRQAIECVKDKPEEKQLIFLKSWNEWGEGNYMEPDLLYGCGYLEVLNGLLNRNRYGKIS